MADNTILDPGAGGDTIATDDVAGVKFQRVKLVDGTLDSTTPVHSGGGVEANALRVTVANDSTGVVSVDDNGAALSVDDNGGSLTVDGSVSLAAAIPAGTNNIGDVDVVTLPTLPAGTNNIGDVDIASAIPAGNNNTGDVDVASIAAGTNAIGNVGVVPRTTGGLTPYQFDDLDETEEDVKGSAGQVFGWFIYNDGANEVYIQFYNATAANVTVGTTAPLFVLPIPAGSAANAFTDIGIPFGTALSIAATTGHSDAGAPAANQVVGTVFYA